MLKKETCEYDSINLFFETCNYDVWFENEELANATKGAEESADLSAMSPLENDEEEVKKGKGLNFLTPNKLLTRFPILLAQIKAGNNLSKLKREIRQILDIFVSE